MLARALLRLGLPVHPAPARTIRSTWAAVPPRPRPAVAPRSQAWRRASEPGPCVREFPAREAWARSGSVPGRGPPARVPGPPRARPTRQLSQSAQERNPMFQPPRASKSRIRSRRRAPAASRCATARRSGRQLLQLRDALRGNGDDGRVNVHGGLPWSHTTPDFSSRLGASRTALSGRANVFAVVGLRGPSPNRTGCWDGIGRPPPTRAEAPRLKLSSEKCAHSKPGGAKEIEGRYTRQEALKDLNS